MVEQLLMKISDDITEIKKGQDSMREELTEVKASQDHLREELTRVKESQDLLREELTDIKQEQSAMVIDIQDMKEKQIVMNERLINVESKQQLVFEQTGKLTEYYTNIMSQLKQTARKEDLEYFDKKLGYHEREIYQIKQRFSAP
ncbi:chromosome segregation ATPase [Cerasibacillus quisquiliarum]|uniref:Uncharacterized protein n=1 Tax=Cerasibacillus quisquiliarum TaxID=227865 RepID=A0A511UX85_9BACI|nr:hypothetical protein [Cerasibacillus quisquiliarum]MBB5145035.1 chromosome segregation ATPase [Cerasibacillus quisquiliarum]GEN30073.1 hypothetical protein CQU01_03110 [Cerasibacillus quisquiliarum]